MTNGDYMRSLSDEELAHDIFIWIISNQALHDEGGLEKFILYYLKQPYNGN